ncbi:aldolase [Oceanobacillus arenosus]|uniref:Aldolase n=1 Tax=Oceanobacillus arenosus TaxID=1229153 RepID=A0A3D8Q4G8_9BACI|nr:aldolase [Oceanobacillus arenosus]RDW22395.1 aldolase [Oceanobacillus arenosus]
MVATTKKALYTAFGYNISSELPFPELPELKMVVGKADITVSKANLSLIWSKLSTASRYFVVKENLVLFQVPDVAIFLIKNGNEILVDSIEGTHEDQLRLYILGTCMGAVLLQRRILPLHGSAIAIDGKAYAIVGDSGAGKSTLASAFLKRGYHLLSDDIIPVTLSVDNIPMATPAYPQQKLWLESLQQFGIESSGFRPIIERETKFAVPVSVQFTNEPTPLAGVFELIKTDSDEISIMPIQNMERFYTLYCHTYRNFIVTIAGLMEWHFNMSAKMMQHLEIFQLRRPTTRFSAHELVDLVLSKISKGVTNT